MSGRICEDYIEKLIPEDGKRKKNSNIAIVTLDDYHNLGKKIVYSVLRANRINVCDFGFGIGIDSLTDKIIENQIELLLISVLIEAWGMNTIFRKEGPPNAGKPLIKNFDQIIDLKAPDVYRSTSLEKVLKSIRMLKKEVNEEAPIIGTAISPFSLPVMQMGFDKYIELIYSDQEKFNKLMEVNMRFTVQWANAQLTAGAVNYFFFNNTIIQIT